MEYFTEIFADRETVEQRVEICKSCDKYLNVSKQCRVCLCVVPLKARWAAAECPHPKGKKWDRVHPNTDK